MKEYLFIALIIVVLVLEVFVLFWLATWVCGLVGFPSPPVWACNVVVIIGNILYGKHVHAKRK